MKVVEVVVVLLVVVVVVMVVVVVIVVVLVVVGVVDKGRATTTTSYITTTTNITNTTIKHTHVYQGLSKHQEVRFTPVTKITKLIVVFWDLSGAIKKLILEDKYQTDHKKNWSAMYLFK